MKFNVIKSEASIPRVMLFSNFCSGSRERLGIKQLTCSFREAACALKACYSLSSRFSSRRFRLFVIK